MPTLPEHVEQDLVAGFILTDIDDGFQRCKPLSSTTFLYRCDVNDDIFELTIDVETLDAETAIDGYYESLEALKHECPNPRDMNMLIAECYFENECPMQLPSS